MLAILRSGVVRANPFQPPPATTQFPSSLPQQSQAVNGLPQEFGVSATLLGCFFFKYSIQLRRLSQKAKLPLYATLVLAKLDLAWM